jgi:hypothetical protein
MRGITPTLHARRGIMARLLRRLSGGSVAALLAGVALVFAGTALASPTFLLGMPDPCPVCDTVTFDGSGLAPGAPVTTQFAAEGVTFQNVQYNDGSLGQSAAGGFSGGSVVNASSADILIIFSGPMQFAAFAYADVGWNSCCGARTLSAYLGGQLVASTDLPLRPARFLTVAGTYPAAAAADAAYSLAVDKVAADSSAVQSQTATVSTTQANLNAAIQAITTAQVAFALDYANYAACNNPICDTIYLAFLVSDAVALSDAQDAATAAAAQLQSAQAQLAALQGQYQADQAALDSALNEKTFYDAAYQQALADDPGPGFIGFAGAPFDTLILSSLGSLGTFPVTTVIDTLEMVAPEPPTIGLLGSALATLAMLRRIRPRLPAAG